ncbi:hypothetical protein K1719_031880 [Acacia pycnantha]|nr:hypothetical protein K1719_031880 [Acacia pycnantha]
MELDFVDCENDCMEFECNTESNPPSSPDINDIVGAPQLNPRLGDEYQVEIPSMTTESEGLELIVNPAHSEAMNNKSLSFALGLPVPLIWIDNEVEDGRNEGQEHFRNNHGAVNVHGPAETSDVKPNITSDNENKLRPITFKLVMTEERKSCQQGQSRTYGSAPDKLSNSWSDADIKSFLLGFFIFGKNFIQIKRFLEDKGMGEILSFYYGKFYKSDEHVRWSDCRKIKRRKCTTGQKLFTGWRQHELLSRINSKVPGQVKDTLLQVSKSYAKGRASLQEYIFSLKSTVGLSTFVEAVAIGKDKADLTSFAAKPPKINSSSSFHPSAPTGKGSSMEQRLAFATALDNPGTTKSVPKRPISDFEAAAQRQLQAAEATRDQVSIELQKIKEDLEKEREALRKTNSDFDQLRKESAMDKKILEQSRSEAEKYLSNLNQLRAAMDSTREAMAEILALPQFTLGVLKPHSCNLLPGVRLDYFPCILGKMDALRTIYAEGTAIN